MILWCVLSCCWICHQWIKWKANIQCVTKVLGHHKLPDQHHTHRLDPCPSLWNCIPEGWTPFLTKVIPSVVVLMMVVDSTVSHQSKFSHRSTVRLRSGDCECYRIWLTLKHSGNSYALPIGAESSWKTPLPWDRNVSSKDKCDQSKKNLAFIFSDPLVWSIGTQTMPALQHNRATIVQLICRLSICSCAWRIYERWFQNSNMQQRLGLFSQNMTYSPDMPF